MQTAEFVNVVMFVLQAETFFSSYDYWMSFEASASSESFFFIIGAYASESVSGYMKQKLQEQAYLAALAAQAQTTYKATMRWEPLLLRYFFQTANYSQLPIVLDQARLPSTRSSDSDITAYQAFINKYGTHYMDSAVFGGNLQLIFTMNSSFASSTNMTFSEKMSAFAITLGFISVGWGHGGASVKSEISSEAMSMSEMSFMGYGGNQALLQAGLYNLWLNTVPASAAPINSTYQPISELIIDDTKRGLMFDAIADYLAMNNSAIPKPNSPFGIPPVVCGSAPGLANTSIQAIPTTDAERTLREDRWRDAQVHGANMLERRAQGKPAVQDTGNPLVGMPLPKVGAVISDRPPVKVGILRDTPEVTAETESWKALQPTQDQLLGGWILPIPGPDGGIGLGYDPVSGTYRAPVVAASAVLANTTFFDPSSNITWRIPDGWTFASTPASCAEEVIAAFESGEAVASFHASLTMLGIGLSFDGIGIGVFFSKEQADASATLHEFEDGYYGMERGISLFELSAGSNGAADMVLTGGFVESLNALSTDPSDPGYTRGWMEFIDTFGTHYVHSGALGGTCSLGIAYNQSALASYSASYKKEQFGIMLGIMLEGIGLNFDLGFTKQQFEQKVDQAFKEASQYSVSCIGGDPSKLSSLDFLGWLLSIYFNPAPITTSIKLRPLYELVTWDDTRRGILQQLSQQIVNEAGGK
jgi:hypothetical protein